MDPNAEKTEQCGVQRFNKAKGTTKRVLKSKRSTTRQKQNTTPESKTMIQQDTKKPQRLNTQDNEVETRDR